MNWSILMKQIEILAPAGSRLSMVGAINAKANAIYLAGKKFGARAYANNFEDDDLYEVINYAHLRGVLVYVAINTLVFDDEIEELIIYTDNLVKRGVDAFIVQDLGVIDILTKRYPNTDIHASTQVNTLNVHQAKFLKKLGVKRIVMARETPIEIIKQIKKQVDIELEVFVHGALCVSFSGNCLMSSMLGGRSGNRGECAQPCRLTYSLIKDKKIVNNESYLLSTKDLMTLDYLDQLIDIGVDSIKIEGRMRKPEYVIQTVISYRKKVDAYQQETDLNLNEEHRKLEKVFNRKFTKGYIFNEIPNEINHDFRPNHMGIHLGSVINYKDNKVTIKLEESLEVNDGFRILGDSDYGNSVSRILKDNEIVKKALPGDIIKLDVTSNIQIGSKVLKTLDHKLETNLSTYLDENYKTIPLKCHMKIKENEVMKLTLSDYKNEITVYSNDIIKKAISKSVDKNQIIDQISKLGNTPFYFESINIDGEENLFIPIKELNEIRRKALEEITKIKTSIIEKEINKEMDLSSYEMDSKPSIVVKVTTKDQLEQALDSKCDVIYYEDIIKDVIPSTKLIPVKKRIQLHPYELHSSKLIHEIGSIETHDFKEKLYTDEFLNVTNIHTVRLLSSKNITRVTLSPELSKDRIFKLVEIYKKTYQQTPGLELVLYGLVDLMITKYCPIAKTFKTKQNCHLCEKNQYYLMDKNGLQFPLINDGNCNLRILNHKPLNLIEYAKELIDLGLSIRLNFTTENKEEVKKIIEAFQLATKIKQNPISLKHYTYGRFINRF
jgi:U32 family peptidase